MVVELTHQSVTNKLVSDDDFWNNNSQRVEEGKKTNNKSAPNLVPHEKDQPFAILLGNDLAVGTHEIKVTITEEGDPWENTREYNWKLIVVEDVETPQS